MKILRVYCIRELVTPFLLSLSLFAFIFLVGSLLKLADLLVNKGVSLWDVFKILLLTIPNLMSFILPTSALASVLLVFGGFAQNNEITAMKASGVNLIKVMLPIAIIALLMSLASLFLVDQIQPRSQFMLRTLVNDLVVKRPAAYLESGRFVKDFKGYVIRVQKVEGNYLKGVTIFQTEAGKATRTIIAERGEISSSGDDKTLGLMLYNVVSDEPNPDDPTVLYKLNSDTLFLPAMSLSTESSRKTRRKVKEMTLDELIVTLRNIDVYQEGLRNDGMSDDDIHHETTEYILQAKAEIHKKISFSMATFCFVLVGLPLALVTRRGEAVVSFFFSMMVVAIYYVLFIWGRTIAVHGYLPAIVAMWIPNLLVMATAFVLTTRVIRL